MLLETKRKRTGWPFTRRSPSGFTRSSQTLLGSMLLCNNLLELLFCFTRSSSARYICTCISPTAVLRVDPLIFSLEMVGIELLDGEVFVLDLSGLLLQKLCNRVVDRNTWVKAPKRTFLAMADRRGLFNFSAIPDKRADALLRRSECALHTVWTKAKLKVLVTDLGQHPSSSRPVPGSMLSPPTGGLLTLQTRHQ